MTPAPETPRLLRQRPRCELRAPDGTLLRVCYPRTPEGLQRVRAEATRLGATFRQVCSKRVTLEANLAQRTFNHALPAKRVGA